MKNPVRGWRKLSKAQLGHLIETGALEHDAFMMNIKRHKEWEETKRANGQKVILPECWTCHQIAKKLGLWDKA